MSSTCGGHRSTHSSSSRSSAREPRPFVNYALLIVEAIDRETASAGNAVASALEESLVDLLLRLQPHNYRRRLDEVQGVSRAGVYKIVSAYVDEHLDQPMSVEDLAAVAGCGVRVLQHIFRELTGTSPLAFIRRRRLAAARKMLETSGSDVSITDVANRCGLSQLGRFASAYKAAYGELPSETVRRAAYRPPGHAG